MPEIKPRKWSPIDDLSDDWQKMRDPGIAALVQVWNEQVAELREKEVYKTFVTQLRREWAIETGVLERLYELNDAATKILIEHGLDTSLLASSDTDKPVEQVIALIRDQESAINSMYQYVAEGRSLTLGYIRELHMILTANQLTCEAEDDQGRSVEMPLRRGDWRQTEAQVTDSERKTWLYCEPALLESQMLNLVSGFQQQADAGVPPEIQAAWLHHRFTLIHPFQDGNGRVARCLATLVMLKANWFPLVVTNKDKSKYIAALRAADGGDLQPLVQQINDLQKRAIRRALSLSASVITENESVKSALATASKRLGDRAKALAKEIRNVTVVAEALHIKAAERLAAVATETDKMMKSHDSHYSARFEEAEHNSQRNFWYKIQIVECAKTLGYFANLPEYHSWVRVAFDTEDRTEILLSFHGIGRDAKGVLCCSAIYCQKDEGGNISAVEPLAADPFEFTYRDDPRETTSRFAIWLDEVISKGVQKWSQTL